MNRKQRRSAAKAAKKGGNEELSEKIFLNQMPDECMACLKPFDKEDKQMVVEWSVVVREEEKVVRLYCPDCWDKATKLVKDLEDK